MDINNCFTIDLETSVNNIGEEAIGKNKASPFNKNNNIVAVGWRHYRDKETLTRYKGWPMSLFDDSRRANSCCIGHNIKFDMLYLLQRNIPEVRKWWDNKDNIVWDTQLAEYLLSGQTVLYPSLDYCAEKRGGTLKDDRIKEYWEAGVKTEDIPKDQLLEYLEHDVENTEIVFKSQIVEAEERGMMPLLYSQMKALKATIEMENNGLEFDKLGAMTYAQELQEELAKKRAYVEANYMNGCMGYMDKADVNCTSLDQVSSVLFGGPYKYTAMEDVLDEEGSITCYKSGKKKGQVKQKKVVKEQWIKGMNVDTKYTRPAAKANFFSVDEATLKKIIANVVGFPSEFCTRLLEIRKLSKDINTYYVGYSSLVWPDNKIHGQLNHCATATGRLASSQPNLQNLSGGD